MNRLLPLLGLFTATLFAACGGKVVVDAPGGGNGGAGGTGSVSSSTGTLPPPDTGPTTGTGPGDLCAELCTFWEQANCNMNDCAGQCAQVFQTAGPCTDELIKAIECILAHPNEVAQCNMPASCLGLIKEYSTCTMPVACSDLSCFANSDGSCGCKGLCSDISVDVECKDGICICNANGVKVGACKDSSGSCDPLGSCCGSVFFPQGV